MSTRKRNRRRHPLAGVVGFADADAEGGGGGVGGGRRWGKPLLFLKRGGGEENDYTYVILFPFFLSRGHKDFWGLGA